MKNIRIAIISDFDGTITERDSLNYLLNHFGPSGWEKYEDRYETGTILGSEALEMEMSQMKISLEKAEEIIREKINIRDDFPVFADFCRKNEIPLMIVSCNFRRFIIPVLEKHNLGSIPIRSNEIEERDGRILINPGGFAHPVCRECHTCKGFTVKEMRMKGFFTIYLGDGLTDRCPAWEADLVFAKGRLKKSLDKHGIENKQLNGFGTITEIISTLQSSEIELESSFEKNKREKKNNPFIRGSE